MVAGVALLALAVGLAFWYQGGLRPASTGDFGVLPPNSYMAAYVDVAALRNSPVIREAVATQTTPAVEQDYAEFVRQTGFNYERDLDSISIAMTDGGSSANPVQAILRGRFNRDRLESYSQSRQQSSNAFLGHTMSIFQGPSGRPFRVTFLDHNRLAFSNAPTAQPMENIISLAEAGGADLEDRLRQLHAFGHVPPGTQAWLVVDMERAGSRFNVPAGAVSPGTSFSADVLRGSRMVLLAARLADTELQLNVVAECAKPEDAQRVADSMNGLKALLGALASRDTKQGQAAEASKALQNISVAVEKNAAVARVRVPVDAIQRALRQPATAAEAR